jgi:hypothetical protein
MSNKEFVGFVKVKTANGQNGSWEYTQISFKQEDLDKMKSFMNDKGYVNLKLNRSQKGSEYLEIDTYGLNQPQQPQSYQQPATGQAANVSAPVDLPDLPVPGDDGSDIPF